MKNTIYVLICFVVFFSCQYTASEESEKSDTNLENTELDSTIQLGDSLVALEMTDTLIAEIENEKNNADVKDWTLDQFIVDCPSNAKIGLKDYLKYLRQEWKNVPNPFIATYSGNDFGDYHHINFTDNANISYDFGFGYNDYGAYELFYDDEQLTDKPNYLGKSFKIYWAWKSSEFPCCSGEYDMVQAYHPSIVKLELNETK